MLNSAVFAIRLTKRSDLPQKYIFQMHRQARFTWNHIILVMVLAVAAGLRLYHLGAESLWLDEIGQALVAQQPLSAILDGVKHHHGAAPFDYLMTAVTVRISHNEWVLRLPSVLWGVLSIYWLYRLGDKRTRTWQG